MKQAIFTLEHTQQLTHSVWELALAGDTSAFSRPGQFVNIEIPGKFLRRPISVAGWTEGGLLLIVQAVGEGSDYLCHAAPGTTLDLLTGLGNGFDPDTHGEHPVLIGGGVGLAPLYGLARHLLQAGLVPTVALGFRSAAEAFYVREFAALGCRVFVATENGSLGTKGFVTDLVRRFAPECDYGFCCGPTPMLQAVYALPGLSGGQFSFEARMGCGFGACMGCTVATTNGYKRICKDGPVLKKEEILW